MEEEDLYETDYYGWLQQQVRLLSERRFERVDLDRLVEEIDDMGRSEPRALESHLVILLLHLLKYQYQTFVLNPQLPEPKEFRSWYASMANARDDAAKILRQSPSLQNKLNALLMDAYSDARKRAVREMNLYLPPEQQLTSHSFPDQCPWTFEQIMAEDWLPAESI